MDRAGKRHATRRSLTLLEVLVVMLLIGLLATGSLQLGKQATEGVLAQLDARKLTRKLRLLSATALAHELPLALHLVKDGAKWRGSFVGRGRSLRPFSLSCDALLLQGKPQSSLLIHADEHGEVVMPELQLVHGRQHTIMTFDAGF